MPSRKALIAGVTVVVILTVVIVIALTAGESSSGDEPETGNRGPTVTESESEDSRDIGGAVSAAAVPTISVTVGLIWAVFSKLIL